MLSTTVLVSHHSVLSLEPRPDEATGRHSESENQDFELSSWKLRSIATQQASSWLGSPVTSLHFNHHRNHNQAFRRTYDQERFEDTQSDSRLHLYDVTRHVLNIASTSSACCRLEASSTLIKEEVLISIAYLIRRPA